ncbi:MAG: hypothetical protein Q9N68_02480, partial [Gammaproteobacteria bacterium]|nr:hypothetical protein [Gammaproteobacteria bacterium]
MLTWIQRFLHCWNNRRTPPSQTTLIQAPKPPTTPKPPPLINLFEAEQRAFNCFQHLSDSSHSALKGIFKDTTPSGFLACGLQEKNILSFWDYCKTRLIENPDQEAEQLTELFNFFFQRYRLAYPNVQIQTVPLGERFNPIAHIRTPSSPVSGTV